MHNIDLNLFKTFYFVAVHNSFTKASEKLYISQPAVTQSIKKLEEQLNVELFKRTSNGIVLTKEGEKVFYYAEQLNNLIEANSNLINKIKEDEMETINIGVPTHIGTFYFIKFLEKFNTKYPNVKINIINKKSDEMLHMLERRELDIVLDTDINNYDSKVIKAYEILKLESCFVCNEKFKDIANKKLSPIELNNYPLILPGKTTSNRKIIDLFFKKKNVVLKPLIEANSSSISKGIIKRGIGIGWMIKEFIKEDIENGKLFEVKVDVDQVLTPVSIAYNIKYNPKIVDEFIRIFKEK